MEKLSFIIGILALIIYLLGYLQTKRSKIILFNIVCRVLYILQYILLGALEGAVLDILGVLSSFLAQNKENKFIRKNTPLVLVGVNLVIVGAGLSMYQNVYSLLPIVGVILQTSAFWISNEKKIRLVSFIGAPFWLVYNLVNKAYGSCAGDILSMVTIGIVILGHDLKITKRFKKKKRKLI